MKYVEHVNGLIRKKFAAAEGVVFFGQNITAGSCLSGLTKNLQPGPNSVAINTPNAENTLAGVGFGLMLSGVSSVFFMKQLDFLTLGVDHLVNTYNFARTSVPKASFTIVAVVVDLGYQGTQSSFNNLHDLCALARAPGYVVTNADDASRILDRRLISPGFRVIAVSQRLFNKETLRLEETGRHGGDCDVFQYSSGSDATIVCLNFSLPQGLELREKLKLAGLGASLFSVNQCLFPDVAPIVENLKATRRIIVLDDSKSSSNPGAELIRRCSLGCDIKKSVLIAREFSPRWYWPDSEEFAVDSALVLRELGA